VYFHSNISGLGILDFEHVCVHTCYFHLFKKPDELDAPCLNTT